MEKIYIRNKELIIKCIIVGLLFGIVYFYKSIFYLFSPFILGYIISLILTPFSSYYVTRFKISDGISAIISIVSFFIILFLGLTALYYYFKEEFILLVNNIPTYKEEVIYVYDKFKILLDEYIILPDFIKSTFSITFENIVVIVNNSILEVISGIAKSVLKSVPVMFMNITLGFISSFFFLKDKELISNSFKKYTPKLIKNTLFILKENVGFALMGYIKAQCILMVMTFCITFTGLLIIKNDYALVLSMTIALIDAIPMFGSGFVLYPWIGYSLLVGQYTTAIYLGIIYCVVFFNRQIFEPKILGGQIGIHPLLTLISIYSGYKIFGVLGLILGPFLVIVIKTVATSDIKDLGGF